MSISSFPRHGIPGADSLSTLSQTTELLQLLISAPVENQQESSTGNNSTENTLADEPAANPTDTQDAKTAASDTGTDSASSETDVNNQSASISYTVSISWTQMKTFLKADSTEEHPLKTLEKLLEVTTDMSYSWHYNIHVSTFLCLLSQTIEV